MSAQFWTDERVEELKGLWGEGRSASQISRIFDGAVTRSAICAKVCRLGLSRGDQARVRPARISGVAAIAAPKRTPPPVIEEPPALVLEDGSHVTVENVRFSQCRWPAWPDMKDGGPEFRLCGHRKMRGSPYCEFHTGRAWQSGRASKREMSKAAREMQRTTGANRAFG